MVLAWGASFDEREHKRAGGAGGAGAVGAVEGLEGVLECLNEMRTNGVRLDSGTLKLLGVVRKEAMALALGSSSSSSSFSSDPDEGTGPSVNGGEGGRDFSFVRRWGW